MKNRTTTLEQTISVIYKEHSAALLSVLVRLFGSHNFDLAEDVFQDAFNKALIHWQETNIPDNPSAWLIQIAKNKALDQSK